MAGGLISPSFVAEVSNFGMLGSLASGYMSLAEVEQAIIEVKARTKAPFALNIFVDYADYDTAPMPKPSEISLIERRLGLTLDEWYIIPPLPRTTDIVQLAVDHQVPIISTVFGLLNDQDTDALKSAGILLMTTVNSIEEVEIAIQNQKSDVLIFQSRNAGGHQGGFLENRHTTSRSIQEQMGIYPNTPCIAAGGVVDSADIGKSIERGFDGVQIGTGFLATEESSASQGYKQALVEAESARSTVVTTSITGKSARGIKNPLACLVLDQNPGFPYLHYATASLRKHAKAIDDLNFQSLWAGTGVSKITAIPSLSDYMRSLL